MRGPLRLRTVIPVALAALALPASAAAHGRTAAIALDYRLALDRSTRDLPGVHIRILDGDRALAVRVDPGTVLLVRGALGESMLRVDASGVWANAASPTATGDKVVSAAQHGWVHLSGGRTVVWHDHRLSPPPATAVGPVGRFVVPVVVDGVPGAISGTFFRVARPPVWPWLLAALLLFGAIVVAIRRRGLRGPLTIGLGVGAGMAALVEVTTFAVRDAPTGGVAWLQVITAFAVAAVLGALLLRLRGRARVHAAGVVGAVAAAVSLGSTPVFWHGVLISALPALGARAACELAIVAGVAAACLSFLRDFDEPSRVKAPAARVRRPLPR
jgi:hypothetical protein